MSNVAKAFHEGQQLSYDDVSISLTGGYNINLPFPATRELYRNALQEFDFPVVVAPMTCFSFSDTEKLITWANAVGSIVYMPRLDFIQDQTEKTARRFLYGKLNQFSRVIPSISADLEDQDTTDVLWATKGNTSLLVDIAYGYTQRVADVASHLSNVKLILGNYFTCNEAQSFINKTSLHNIQGVRIGIGGGSACTTRTSTGCGVGSVNALLDRGNDFQFPSGYKPTYIADGGIKNDADIIKALQLGADVCMAGRLFAEMADIDAATYQGTATHVRKNNHSLEGVVAPVKKSSLTLREWSDGFIEHFITYLVFNRIPLEAVQQHGYHVGYHTLGAYNMSLTTSGFRVESQTR
jgi:hypothetical protein